MVEFMNAFYALEDIKKRTKKYYDKRDGVVDEAGNANFREFEENDLQQTDM